MGWTKDVLIPKIDAGESDYQCRYKAIVQDQQCQVFCAKNLTLLLVDLSL